MYRAEAGLRAFRVYRALGLGSAPDPGDFSLPASGSCSADPEKGPNAPFGMNKGWISGLRKKSCGANQFSTLATPVETPNPKALKP